MFATFTLAYSRAFKIWGLRTSYLAEIDARKKDSNFRLPRTTKTFFASVILFNPVRNEYEVKTQSFPVHFYGVKCGVLKSYKKCYLQICVGGSNLFPPG